MAVLSYHGRTPIGTYCESRSEISWITLCEGWMAHGRAVTPTLARLDEHPPVKDEVYHPKTETAALRVVEYKGASLLVGDMSRRMQSLEIIVQSLECLCNLFYFRFELHKGMACTHSCYWKIVGRALMTVAAMARRLLMKTVSLQDYKTRAQI